MIEQIKKDHLETDKKKEVLREREIFWQRSLNSIQQNEPWFGLFSVVHCDSAGINGLHCVVSQP